MESTWPMILIGIIAISMIAIWPKAFGKKARHAGLGVVPDVCDPLPEGAMRVKGIRGVDGPRPSEDGCQHRVRFAGRWYACQQFSSSDPQISSSMFKMGLGVVKLTDRRTYSRWIVRPLDQIQSLA
ncbi:MAG: hypothetical protein AAB501_02525 [Patescibacteria group bacterium]